MTTEKTMFNDEQKWRYIIKKESEVTLAPGFLQNLFVKAAPFEEMYDKDLCEWTLTEILEFYKFLDLYSLESVALLNSNYALYTSWALTETLVPDGQNHFLEVDNDAMLGCLNTSLLEKTIITREELEERADTLINYTDRFVFYALFEGLYGKYFEEIINAKLSDIRVGSESLSGAVINLSTGRFLAISPKLREVAEMADAEEGYQSFIKEGRFSKYRTGDDCIFKVGINRNQNDANDVKNKAQVLLRRYVKCVDYLGLSKQMTTKRLAMSGKIDYIKRIMEREGLPLEETLRKHREEIDYIYPVERLKSIPLFVKKYERIIAKQLRNQNL